MPCLAASALLHRDRAHAAIAVVLRRRLRPLPREHSGLAAQLLAQAVGRPVVHIHLSRAVVGLVSPCPQRPIAGQFRSQYV